MASYSDVRIIVSEEGFFEFRKEVEKYIKENNCKYNLLDKCDFKEQGKKQVYIGWNRINWNMFLSEVQAIENSLYLLEEKDYSYRFAELGENEGEYELRTFDSSKEENLDYPNLIRKFDDDFIKDLITKERKSMDVSNAKENELEYE